MVTLNISDLADEWGSLSKGGFLLFTIAFGGVFAEVGLGAVLDDQSSHGALGDTFEFDDGGIGWNGLAILIDDL